MERWGFLLGHSPLLVVLVAGYRSLIGAKLGRRRGRIET